MHPAYDAMRFAREAHKKQVRKYTGNPYTDHLAEVVGLVATVGGTPVALAVAWLHDTVEDTETTFDIVNEKFGTVVAYGVSLLSDFEKGNRAARKKAARDRLEKAPGWVQTIKVADLISNTASIVQHDPKFAPVYLEEKHLLLDVLTKADAKLVKLARTQLA